MKQERSKRPSKLDRMPEVLKPEHLWERQPGESEKAFAAFRVGLEMGPKRSLAAVAQECTRHVSLIKRWASRWEWTRRFAAYADSLAAKTDKQTAVAVVQVARSSDHVL